MLWVFGDSYSVHTDIIAESNDSRTFDGKFPPIFPIEKNWTQQVSELVTGNKKYNNFSVAGCSNEHIYHTYSEQLAGIKSGDFVLVCLTAKNRRWLLKDFPHFSNWSNCDVDPNGRDTKKVKKEQWKAIENYGKYLNHEAIDDTLYDALIWAFIAKAHELSMMNVKFLMLPGFHEKFGCEGTLLDISMGEFETQDVQDEFYLKTTDRRWNHMSEPNHKVLANKVAKFFLDQDHQIDLTKGFQTNIYTKNNIKNYLTS